MPERATLAIALLLAGVLAGCGGRTLRLYDGDPRPAGAVAVLVLPEAIEVARINGAEVSGARGPMRSGDLALELAPGRYQVLAFYREIWQSGDRHDTLRSDPALFDFEARAGARYRLEYPHPASLDQARQLAATFAGWIEDPASGTRVPSRDSGLQFRKGLAGALGDDTLVEAGPVAGAGQAVPPLPPAAGAAGAPGGDDWLLLMKGWWQQASPQERRAFLQWAGEPSADGAAPLSH